MSWAEGMIVVLFVAIFLPWAVAEIRAARRPKRRFVQRDRVAHRHRAIARNGFKSRQGIR